MVLLTILLPFIEPRGANINLAFLILGGLSVFMPFAIYSGYILYLSHKRIMANDEGLSFGKRFFKWQEIKDIYYEKYPFFPKIVLVLQDERQIELLFFYSGMRALRFISTLKDFILERIQKGRQEYFCLSHINRLALFIVPSIFILPLIFWLFPYLLYIYIQGYIHRIYVTLTLAFIVMLIYSGLLLYRVAGKSYFLDTKGLKILLGKRIVGYIPYSDIRKVDFIRLGRYTSLVLRMDKTSMRISSQIGNLSGFASNLKDMIGNT